MFLIILYGETSRSKESFQEELKKEFQRLYSDETSHFPLTDACCPYCGKKGSLGYHGFYTRCLIVCGICIIVSIQRLRRSECGHTHALMPSFIIPYEKKFCIDLLALLSDRHPDFRLYHAMSMKDLLELRSKYSSLSARCSSRDILSDISSTTDWFIKVTGNIINKLLSSSLKNRTGFRLLRFPAVFHIVPVSSFPFLRYF